MTSTTAVSLVAAMYTDIGGGLTNSFPALLVILSGLIVLGFMIKHVKKWISKKA